MVYLYRNPKTGEIKEVAQGAHEKHEFSEKGIKWEREFTVPQAAMDTKWDPRDPKDFVTKTRSKKGTLDNLYQAAGELRQERLDKDGHDPVRENYYQEYSKRRKGKKLIDQRREELVKNPPKGVEIEL